MFLSPCSNALYEPRPILSCGRLSLSICPIHTQSCYSHLWTCLPVECSKQVLMEHSTTFLVFCPSCPVNFVWKTLVASNWEAHIYKKKINEVDEVKHYICCVCIVFHWVHPKIKGQIFIFCFSWYSYHLNVLGISGEYISRLIFCFHTGHEKWPREGKSCANLTGSSILSFLSITDCPLC